jgi:hypothetical protein
MYRGYQEELFKSSWGVNPGFAYLRDKLNEMIPLSGACENARTTNKALDKFRRAQNVIYDLFNNGLCNRRGEYRRMFGEVPLPGIRSQHYISNIRWSQIEDEVEANFTPIILAAAKEQGLI